MKFKDYLLKEAVVASIDDNDVLQTLDANDIAYTRTKNDKGALMYTFDNRFSIKYDGSTFILYRSENKVHVANARNKAEIEQAISTWNGSYSLSTTEITDDDVEDIVAKMKSDAAEEDKLAGDNSDSDEKPEDDAKDDVSTDDSEAKKDDSTDKDDDFYKALNNNDDDSKGDKK